MDKEIKNCQNCKQEFTIEPEDFNFYEKIKVPVPTFCPECRRQRRMTWRNDFTFYKRKCDATGENIISIYAPEKERKVYNIKYWWSDSWDPKSYGRDFDFSRPFFEQFYELQKDVPVLALMNDNGIGSINCEYTQNEAYAKNCYMVSMSWKNEDCMYSYGVSGPNAVEIVDSVDIFSSGRIYESVFLNQSYDCKFAYYSQNLMSCYFVYGLRNCKNCFMSVGLRDKQYFYKNKQYSKEKYEEILKNYNLYTFDGQEKAKKEFEDFKKDFDLTEPFIINCVDCLGDGLLNSNNAKFCYTGRRLHNVKYFENGNDIKDGYDMLTGGENEMCYEGITVDNDRLALFTIFSWRCSDIAYTEYCFSSQDLFGCVGIKQSQYCIFNKQYLKEEYFELREKIIDHMKKTGEYGEFFPAKYSPFGYNETVADNYYPLDKGAIEKQGFKHFENLQITKGKGTIAPEKIPNDINHVQDDFLREILTCETTGRNYFITKDELNFYRKMQIPIPKKCFFARHQERLIKRKSRYFH